MVHVLATREPDLFARTVVAEVAKAVSIGRIPYPNLRVAGSGETIDEYIPALSEITRQGVRLWGFTRNLRLAERMRAIGVGVIVSCDRTSSHELIREAGERGFPLGYTSDGVDDRPPPGTLVTFPVHRVGRVREVVDSPTLCPKVVADFLDESRPEAFCQRYCRRCHLGESAP
jgi:hypothetical protein